MEFTWMTSQSWSLKWQRCIFLKGTQMHTDSWLECYIRADFPFHSRFLEIPEHSCANTPPLPCSDGGAVVRSSSDPGLRSTSLSPQSLSSGGDSGVDSYCDPMTDLPSIAISLCGGLTDNREIDEGRTSHTDAELLEDTSCAVPCTNMQCVYVCLLTEQFHAKTLSYQQFAENPSMIDDPNLVVKIGSK